ATLTVAEPVEPSNAPSPLYVAVTTWSPTGSGRVTVSTARDVPPQSDSAAVPRIVRPMLNVTDPAGTAAAVDTGATAAVTCAVSPNVMQAGSATTDVTVAPVAVLHLVTRL